MNKKRLSVIFGCFVLFFAVIVASVAYLILHRVKGEYFDSNGVRIHYTVEGKGEPVILVHGLAANADLNWRLPGVTAALRRDFQVIMLDCRGHGLSESPEDPEAYGMELGADVIRLMDHLGIEKAHMAGYSMGGFILLKLLETHPERFLSAAICSAGWKRPDDDRPLPNPYQAPPREAALRGTMNASVMPAQVFFAEKRGPIHAVRNWVGDRINNRTALKALKKSSVLVAIPEETLRNNTVPAICFIGDRDGFLPYAKDLHRVMAHFEFVLLPGANHLTAPIQPAFRRGLRAFFLQHRETDEKKAPSMASKGRDERLKMCAVLDMGR